MEVAVVVVVEMKKCRIVNLRLYLVDVVDYVVVVVAVLKERQQKKKRNVKLVEMIEGSHSRGYCVNEAEFGKDVTDSKDEHWEKDD